LVKFDLRLFQLASVGIWELGPPKTDDEKYLIINNSAAHLPIVLKFGGLVRYETSATGEF